MRRLALLSYLSILLLSLAAAYLSWTREPGKSGGKVPVLSCQRGDLSGLEFRGKSRTALFSRKRSAYSGKTFWWIETASTPALSNVRPEKTREVSAGAEPVEPMPAEGSEPGVEEEGADAQAAQGKAAPGETKTEVFKADAKIDEALARFCPWMALRGLGKPGDEKRREFGLADAEDRLILKFETGDHAFRVGVTAYGHQDRYLEDEKTGEIYLVSGQDIREIEYPKSRFLERDLHGFSKDHVVRIRIRSGEREKELVAKVDEQGNPAGWADSRGAQEPKELYGNWMQKYFALRILEYVVPQQPGDSMGCSAPPEAAPALMLTFFDPGSEIGFFTLYREPGKEADPSYSACTDNTDCLVRLPKTQVEGLLKDLEDLLSEP